MLAPASAPRASPRGPRVVSSSMCHGRCVQGPGTYSPPPADILGGSEKTHSGHDVPDTSDVVTMSEVRACARALVQRVAEGGEIPIASLRELGDLVLRSELVAVSHQVLHGEPEFALRRAMELSGLILAVVATDRRDAEQEAAK